MKNILIFFVGIALGYFIQYLYPSQSVSQTNFDRQLQVVIDKDTYKVAVKNQLYDKEPWFAAICRGRVYVEEFFIKKKINKEQYKRATEEIEKKIMISLSMMHNITDEKSKEIAREKIKIFLRETDKLIHLLRNRPEIYKTEDKW